MKDIAQELTEEVCSLFPEQTKKYRGLIQQCIGDIVKALPKDMSREQYAATVRTQLQLVRDGKPG